MRMALEARGISREAVAAELGVDRKTISRWTHDVGAAPKRAYVAQWAMLTGVPIEWLETGNAPEPEGPEGISGADDETRTRNILLGRRNIAEVVHLPFAA